MKLLDFYEGFAKWFRHELSDVDFIWNLTMLAVTDGFWIFVMILYYTFRRK